MSSTSTITPPRRRVVTSGRLGLVCGVAALTVSLGVPSQAARMISGHDIKKGTVTGTQVKNDSLTGADVKESTLRGVLKPGAVAAFGASVVQDTDNFTSSTRTALVSKTFTTSGPGLVYVTASLSAEDDFSLAGLGMLFYGLTLDGAALDGTDPAAHELGYATDGAGDSGAVTAVVKVGKGSHTVALVGQEVGAGSYLTSEQVSVLFVPSGSGFDPSTLTKTPAAAHQR